MTFFFYDLETSGFNPREARIMQFAGQRTDLELNPIGEPFNILIRMSDDVVPDPDAVLVTGITPQTTLGDGIHEAEFLRLFHEQIATPDTIFVGYNTVRFDDEFMRYLHYRNFYDPYEWQWRDGRSRWDLLDVVRMTRALRPEEIKWPVDSNGKATNRLELLTKLNGLDHEMAHDALNDVQATIAIAQLIRDKQPRLFDFLLDHRSKQAVAKLATAGNPFVYTSGKYPGEFEKTTVVATLVEHPPGQAALVYDLRHDPTQFASLDVGQLVEALRWKKPDEPGLRLPVKTLKYNRCPAIAPLGVLNPPSQQRLQLDPAVYQANFSALRAIQDDFATKVIKALNLMDQKQQARLLSDDLDADARLYDGFFGEQDRTKMSVIRAADAQELGNLNIAFQDDRLEALLPLYKARNFPRSLSDEERAAWETFRQRKLLSGHDESRLAKYFHRLSELAQRSDLTGHQKYLLEELQLYGQSVMPESDA